MSKETKLSVVEIQDIRCYIDKDNVAWINAEDAVRGLGFVMVRNERVTTSGDSYEAVRWSRVNDYLCEFGYDKTVGKDDFIPEGVFYMLAMKASNEAAIKFQKRIAFEILPFLRKHGYYAMSGQICDGIEEFGQLEDPFLKMMKLCDRYSVLTEKLEQTERELDELQSKKSKLIEKRNALSRELEELRSEVEVAAVEFLKPVRRKIFALKK